MADSTKSISIAYFISPHGFGHAARACSVMEAFLEQVPNSIFHIFTLTPEWFFWDSIKGSYVYHTLGTDIGLVQTSPFEENLEDTILSLRKFIPFDPDQLNSIADELKNFECKLVISDISSLGIAIAKKAGIPSILIENFTWDWIYEEYVNSYPVFQFAIDYFSKIYASVDHHIQTIPVCNPSAHASLVTRPVSRRSKNPAEATRQKLGIMGEEKVVLITLGGFKTDFKNLPALQRYDEFIFVVPGGSAKVEKIENLILLPHHSSYYHPDLIETSDIVIGKVGYSTLAEVSQVGVPFGFIGRSRFRESKILEGYILKELGGVEILESEFENGNWLQKLSILSSLKRKNQRQMNGADQIANYLLRLF
jgi:hypothetical protein